MKGVGFFRDKGAEKTRMLEMHFVKNSRIIAEVGNGQYDVIESSYLVPVL